MALTYGGVDIDLHVDSPSGSLEPMAPIARRGPQGKLLSAITSTRGQKFNAQGLYTVPLNSSDADTQEAALTSGIPESCSGMLTGSITALASNVRREPIAGGTLFVLTFDLLES